MRSIISGRRNVSGAFSLRYLSGAPTSAKREGERKREKERKRRTKNQRNGAVRGLKDVQ
jgi:hypothetical protein